MQKTPKITIAAVKTQITIDIKSGEGEVDVS